MFGQRLSLATGVLHWLGIFSIPFGIAVGVFGYARYRTMDRAIRTVRSSMAEAKED